MTAKEVLNQHRDQPFSKWRADQVADFLIAAYGLSQVEAMTLAMEVRAEQRRMAPPADAPLKMGRDRMFL